MTYAKLAKMDKADRLKAVGMLASRKFIQEFVKGKMQATYIEEAPTARYFYAACHEVGEVMNSVRLSCDGFLLYWVDGLFIDTPDPTPIADALTSLGYRTTIERVTNMRRSEDGRYYFYTKGTKSTYLCIPQRVEYKDRDLVDAVEKAIEL